ncbi:unnamed protein product [Amoebophrya sp. A120]|nr:unnamed protein product [Amoebophrya sp. A120]|eukprot:GSA120T00001580001.1
MAPVAGSSVRNKATKSPMFHVGPMSRNVVDALAELCDELEITIGLLPSRRQIDFDGGYSNNWTTKGFAEYVAAKNASFAGTDYALLMERDHGGPKQGSVEDDGCESFATDAQYFDLIHVDPWAACKDLQEGIDMTIKHIQDMCKQSTEPKFEVGTEEAIRPFTSGELEILLRQLKIRLTNEEFARIEYVVIQSGVALDLANRQNVGVYNKERLKEMVKIVHKYGKKPKEHNGDYLSRQQCQERFTNGVAAVNIAPAFGQIETACLLTLLREQDISASSPTNASGKSLFEEMYQLCYDSAKWKKWNKNNLLNPRTEKEKLILICGHYVLSYKTFVEELKPKILEAARTFLAQQSEEVMVERNGATLSPDINVLYDSYVVSEVKKFFTPYLEMAKELQTIYGANSSGLYGTSISEVPGKNIFTEECDLENRAGGLTFQYYDGYGDASAAETRKTEIHRVVWSAAPSPYYYATYMFPLPGKDVTSLKLSLDFLDAYTLYFRSHGSNTASGTLSLKFSSAAGAGTESTPVSTLGLDQALDVRGYFLEVELTGVKNAHEGTTFCLYVAGIPSSRKSVVNNFVEDCRADSKNSWTVVNDADSTSAAATGVAGLTGGADKPPVQATMPGGRPRSKSVEEVTKVIKKSESVKKVVKPWGHELWITSPENIHLYCLKEIMLKSGKKTSLQYHVMKRETNVLVEGRAVMWYQKNADPPTLEAKLATLSVEEQQGNAMYKDVNLELGQQLLWPLSAVGVTPPLIHRVEALSDILLYEVSTPQLDDVIRIQDDTNRAAFGRIASEHESSQTLKVCILAAGTARHMGPLCSNFNKALLPIHGKAVISRIIKKFLNVPTTGTRLKFVVALGFQGEQVKNYLLAAHSDLDFDFVEVPDYDKAGSGPGKTLWMCKDAIGTSEPFYWTCCDTDIGDGEIPFAKTTSDWVGVCQVNAAISEKYCNFAVEGDRIVSVKNKIGYYDMSPDKRKSKQEPVQDLSGGIWTSFIGLSYIKSADVFWKAMEEEVAHAAGSGGSCEIIPGLEAIMQKDYGAVEALPFAQWQDLGSLDQYLKVVAATFGENFNFQKPDEYLYFVNGRVIKFFQDEAITRNRVLRARANPGVCPEIETHAGQFLAYKFIPGTTMYVTSTTRIFRNLLQWLHEKVWLKPGDAGLVMPADMKPNQESFQQTCARFYQEKTLKRVAAYHKKYPQAFHISEDGKKFVDKKNTINGIANIPSMELLLAEFPFELLTEHGEERFFHGDLQFDNVIYNPEADSFCCIDWRQDFGNPNTIYGDFYYDLAKMYGGLIMNYDYVKENKFQYAETAGGDISFDWQVRHSGRYSYLPLLEEFIENTLKCSVQKVKLLVGIVFLNMSPLHDYPFDKMLWAFAREWLNTEISNYKRTKQGA